MLRPEELAAQLGMPLWWVDERRFDLPCTLRLRDGELVGVRAGAELEAWTRAAMSWGGRGGRFVGDDAA